MFVKAALSTFNAKKITAGWDRNGEKRKKKRQLGPDPRTYSNVMGVTADAPVYTHTHRTFALKTDVMEV